MISDVKCSDLHSPLSQAPRMVIYEVKIERTSGQARFYWKKQEPGEQHALMEISARL
jgi:hypothetical protein